MEILYLGHSCFQLKWKSSVVLTDPFPGSIGVSMGQPTANIVTVSHDHPHHNYTDGIQGNPHIIRGPGEYELEGIFIRGILTPPGPQDPPSKRNTAYLVEADGLHLCHLGDISHPITGRLAEQLEAADILFVPVGSGCTLDIPQIVEIIGQLSPRLVIPMHYRYPGIEIDLNSLDPFLHDMGVKESIPQTKIIATSINLSQETRLAVMEPVGLRSLEEPSERDRNISPEDPVTTTDSSE